MLAYWHVSVPTSALLVACLRADINRVNLMMNYASLCIKKVSITQTLYGRPELSYAYLRRALGIIKPPAHYKSVS